MSFFEVMCANILTLGITSLFLTGASIQLMGKIPCRNGKHNWAILISLVLFIFLNAFLGTVFWKSGMFSWEHNVGEVLFQYVETAGFILLLRVMYKKPYGRTMVSAIFIGILHDIGWNLAQVFMPNRIYHLDILSERRAYLFEEWVIVPLFLFLVIVFLRKTKAGKLYEQWESQKLHPGVMAFMVLYPVLWELVQEAVEANARLSGYNPMTVFIFLMVVYIIFMYVGRGEMQRKQIEEQNVSLRQQEAYIENLEGLQREVRRFRHDFKNMMTGMYMQAKEGDMEAIQSYIQEMTSDFDMQVGSQIRIMNQLANIRVAEVKGLFLEKLKDMQENDIHCELEVFRPFEKTGLRSTDLCRCLGILLDNAMEEVRGKRDGQIQVLISSQDGCTTFRVKNTLYSKVDFHKLGTLGYSTKGTDRGIGLANYKKILERYEKALPLTAIQDGYFIQELKVQEQLP